MHTSCRIPYLTCTNNFFKHKQNSILLGVWSSWNCLNFHTLCLGKNIRKQASLTMNLDLWPSPCFFFWGSLAAAGDAAVLRFQRVEALTVGLSEFSFLPLSATLVCRSPFQLLNTLLLLLDHMTTCPRKIHSMLYTFHHFYSLYSKSEKQLIEALASRNMHKVTECIFSQFIIR